jgi:endonuclease G
MLDRRKERFASVPRWIAQRIARLDRHLAEGRDRPTSWFSVPDLQVLKVAATDSSYEFSRKFRAQEAHDDWYERGHLAAKYLAERLHPPESEEKEGPGWFTHNIANAVPQRGTFNKKPWFTLECFTGAWANRYGEVWVIAGPIFVDDKPQWLKSDKNKSAIPVAIPDSLFKVVVKKSEEGAGLDVLGFIYKQKDARYATGPWDPLDYVVSIEHIEQLTQVEFFPGNAAFASDMRHRVATEIWEVEKKNFDPSCRRAAPKTDEEE